MRALAPLAVSLLACSANAGAAGGIAPVTVEVASASPASARPVDVPAPEAPPPTAVVARFLDSANSDDDAGARATSTVECWSKHCAAFARQAGRKFQARVAAPTRRARGHAVASVDVICPGERRCDFVYLLLTRSDGEWRVSDVTESDAEASGWAP